MPDLIYSFIHSFILFNKHFLNVHSVLGSRDSALTITFPALDLAWPNSPPTVVLHLRCLPAAGSCCGVSATAVLRGLGWSYPLL